ncbi:MAG: hypothetical protein ACLP1X_03690 [Polyangiaceae bacterium]
MAHHKRRRPKQRRAGCLLCKPQKLPSLKKAERRHARRDALLHELGPHRRVLGSRDEASGLAVAY